MPSAGRSSPTGSLRLVAVAGLMLAVAVACGGSNHAPTRQESAPTILRAKVEPVSFRQVRQAVEGLYAHHPGIRSFQAQDVEYTTRTRDRVLSVCRRGGAAATPAALESSRVTACAPLIFFFYTYGTGSSAARHSPVPEAIAVARELYWYVAGQIHGPFDAQAAVVTVLRAWGID